MDIFVFIIDHTFIIIIIRLVSLKSFFLISNIYIMKMNIHIINDSLLKRNNY